MPGTRFAFHKRLAADPETTPAEQIAALLMSLGARLAELALVPGDNTNAEILAAINFFNTKYPIPRHTKKVMLGNPQNQQDIVRLLEEQLDSDTLDHLLEKVKYDVESILIAS